MIGAIVRSLAGLPERRSLTGVSANSLEWLIGARSAAGVDVTPHGALASTTVMACVNLIARSLASVSLVLYRRQDDQAATPATDHPLYPLLSEMANPLQTAMEVRETLFANVLLYGNAYCEIEWGADGYPAALWPLAADRVGLEISKDRSLTYTYWSDDFGMVKLPGYRVHHLRGLATSGLLGISPIRAAMNAVGLALATEQFGGRYFSEGAAPSMVLSHPAKLTPEAMRNLRASFENQWSGLNNAHRVAVLAEGVKPEAFAIRADEAQFLETRSFQVAEICRIFNVSPGLVGAAETQTYASAEQDMIRFRELTLGPWAEALEKRIAADLLLPAERAAYFAQHKLAKLQATDLRTRYETYNVAKQAGILTTNEIRRMEDYNPVAGGDELWMPLNMAPASVVAAQAAQQEPQPQPEPDDEPDDDTDGAEAERLLALLAAWTADVRRRLDARIANDVRQQGARALRHGGRLGLSEWGEGQMHGWRMAGEEMLAAVPGGDGDVAAWVTGAYQAAVAQLIAGGSTGSLAGAVAP